MKTYRSAVSPILASVIGLCWIMLMWMNIMSRDLTGLALLTAVGLFFTYMYFSTTYAIGDGALHVRSGFVVKERVEIAKITRISRTNDLLAAPAFSFDRLVIRYGKDRVILISPKERKQFLAELLAINPSITVEEKAAS